MKTSPQQLKKLWAEWRKLARLSGCDAAEEKAMRADFTRAELGLSPTEPVPSWSDLKPRQVDLLMQGLEQALSGGLGLVETPAGLMTVAEAAAYRRLCFGIEADAVAAYGCTNGAEQAIISMLDDMQGRSFSAGDWRKLDMANLAKLRTTASSRYRAKFAQSA